MEILQTITDLSHEFGVTAYVRGGGGNTSCKNADTLWVKPSGTTLGGLKPETFVAVDREKLSVLYAVQPPAEAKAREALVKETMANAVKEGSAGRPSVETPLHNSLSATYVVHTHPALLNGATCSQQAETVCKKLFPKALWVPYTDPGYTLCIKVRGYIEDYKKQYGCEPAVILMENHGVIVSGDTPEQVRAIYAGLFEVITAEYKRAGVSIEMPVFGATNEERIEAVKAMLAESIGKEQDVFVAGCGMFDYAEGPISPDHIVYSKSYAFVGEPTVEAVTAFKEKNGYWPCVVVWDDVVCGVGTSQTFADLALEFAQDGCHIKQLAQAFGGVQYMTDQQRGFIEGWEGEAYRKKQLEK